MALDEVEGFVDCGRAGGVEEGDEGFNCGDGFCEVWVLEEIVVCLDDVEGVLLGTDGEVFGWLGARCWRGDRLAWRWARRVDDMGRTREIAGGHGDGSEEGCAVEPGQGAS